MRQVLDAHALLAYLEREPGARVVETALNRAAERNQPLLMTVVNWGEILYTVLRECGEEQALRVERLLASFPIELVSVDQTLARVAAWFKARGGISYADCCAAALARQLHAELLTGDREFKVVARDIKICWIDQAKH